ncbi:MAG: hypothetical protein H6Q93_1186 [Nitrospirae bacterium]|jgi:hypothetical protein|nr:hypothetical protein [Nitrospirota bacterium]MBS1127197.1 hypothetical protein [Nitrospirota bacterium]MBS1234783.1 hypothetical protein [Nitrospirota bacterium]
MTYPCKDARAESFCNIVNAQKSLCQGKVEMSGCGAIPAPDADLQDPPFPHPRTESDSAETSGHIHQAASLPFASVKRHLFNELKMVLPPADTCVTMLKNQRECNDMSLPVKLYTLSTCICFCRCFFLKTMRYEHDGSFHER